MDNTTGRQTRYLNTSFQVWSWPVRRGSQGKPQLLQKKQQLPPIAGIGIRLYHKQLDHGQPFPIVWRFLLHLQNRKAERGV
jgi:hypothetical protein